MIQGGFFHWSAQFSVPKWKTMGSQSEILFHEILHVKRILIGWTTFFFLVLKIGRTSKKSTLYFSLYLHFWYFWPSLEPDPSLLKILNDLPALWTVNTSLLSVLFCFFSSMIMSVGDGQKQFNSFVSFFCVRHKHTDMKVEWSVSSSWYVQVTTNLGGSS